MTRIDFFGPRLRWADTKQGENLRRMIEIKIMESECGKGRFEQKDREAIMNSWKHFAKKSNWKTFSAQTRMLRFRWRYLMSWTQFLSPSLEKKGTCTTTSRPRGLKSRRIIQIGFRLEINHQLLHSLFARPGMNQIVGGITASGGHLKSIRCRDLRFACFFFININNIIHSIQFLLLVSTRPCQMRTDQQ